ncbi:MAG: Type 1 glutamine amidotransferase-like domain-containing protein [Candidatus Shapirobacteria bacterium]|jgi:dipeptidase E
MNLLLTSDGITNPLLAQALLDLVGWPFAQTSLAFIPTAANVEVGDKTWLINDFQNLKNLGFSSIDIVDISSLPPGLWQPRLENADILVFGGGNTFHLIYWLRQSGLAKLLPKYLKTKVYMGISAGSMVVSKSIFLTSDKPVYDQDRLGVVDDSGLNLVDFYVRPHFD